MRRTPTLPVGRRGLTIVHVLVILGAVAVLVVIVLAIIAGLTLPALAKARATARQVKDATQLSQIYKGWLIASSDLNTGSLPTPGLANRVGTIPGQGEEDVARNSHDNLHGAMVTMEYCNPILLVSPSESSGNVLVNALYDIEVYSPAQDIYWDEGNASRMRADLDNVSHTSYATMLLFGQRRAENWSSNMNARHALVGNRGVQNSSYADADYLSSKTLGIHGGRKEWVGNTCYGDGRVELSTTFFPESVEPLDINGTISKDGLFSLEGEQVQGNGLDVFLCVIRNSGVQNDPGFDGLVRLQSWD